MNISRKTELDELFEEMERTNFRCRAHILARLFGMMESLEEKQENMNPNDFFRLIEKMIK